MDGQEVWRLQVPRTLSVRFLHNLELDEVDRELKEAEYRANTVYERIEDEEFLVDEDGEIAHCLSLLYHFLSNM